MAIGDWQQDRQLIESEAAQVALLLNTRNQLTRAYDVKRVLEEWAQYRIIREGGRLVACVQLRPVQWYQWEVLHLSVHEDCVGRGLGGQLLQIAKADATRVDIKLLQCTIRAGNVGSERLFSRAGFSRVSAFHNPRSGNNVAVWQHVLVPQRSEN